MTRASASDPTEPEDEADDLGSEAKLIPPRGPMLEGASFVARLQDRFGDAVDPEISLQDDESGSGGAGEDDDAGDEDSGAETDRLLTKLSEKEAETIRYRIKGEIARGGMGAILRVWDDDLRRNFAMKVLLSRRGDDDLASQRAGEVDKELLSRFLEEAQITGQLDHPGIVPVHDLGLDARGRVYFTMRLVRGRDLKGILDLLAKGEQGWSLTKALHVVLKVCEAMAFAHSKGVVHRDLKPANIMVGRFGETYVMDWGLARVLGRRDSHDMRLKPADASALSLVRTARRTDASSEDGSGDAKSPLVTMDGDVIGTPSFMSPEQALGKLEEVGPRSDVYSLGSILYQILTGHAPYVKPDAKLAPHTVLMSVIEGPPTPVDVANPNVPGELAAICNKAMARDADARYPTMLEMAADIEAFLEGRVVSAYEAGPFAEARKWVQRNRGLAATIGLAALLAIGGIAGVIAVQVTKATELRLANQDLIAAKLTAEQKERQALEAQAAATSAAQEAEAAEAVAKEQAELAQANAEIAKARSYMSDIRAAEYTLRLRQVGETLGLLARCDEDQRGWEWAHLNLRSQSQLGPPAHRTTPVAALVRTGGGRVLIVMDYGQLEAYEAGPGGLAAKRKFGDKLWAVGRPDHVDFGLDPTGEVAAVIGRKPGAVVLLNAVGVDDEPAPDPAELFEPYELVEGDGGWLPPAELDVPATRDAEPTRLAFGPRDDLLAVGYDNGVVLLWDHAARDLLFALGDPAADAAGPDLGAPDRAITALAWSSDGRDLVATSADGRLRGWNADSGEERLTRAAHEGAALAVAYAQVSGGDGAGGLIATGGADGRVRLWRAGSGSPIARHATHTGPVRSLAFRPDARALVSGGDDTTLQVWDLDEASARLEAGGGEQAELAESREVSALLGHEGAVSALSYSADGALLYSASRDGSLRAWDPEYGGPVTELIDGRYTRSNADVQLVQVTAVDFHPNGWMCLTGHADGSIAIWDSLRGELHDVLRAQLSAITRARWSPDGRTILSASVDKTVVLYDVEARRASVPFQHTERVIDAALTPDQQFVVTACADNVAHVFRTATGVEEFKLEGHEGWVNAVLVTPDGREVWTASREGKLRLWDTTTGAQLGELDCGSEIRTLAQSGDGRLLATGLSDGRLAVLDTERWRSLGADSEEVERSGADESPWLFDKEVIQSGDPITALAFNHAPSDADTARLVAGSSDGTVRIYHARTGDNLLTLRDQGDSITGLAFSPDDTRLLSGASRIGHQSSLIGPGESAARIWETGQTAQRRTARRDAARLEREAEPVVQTLFATFFLRERVLRNLASWPLEDDVRRTALRLARVRRDDGLRLAEESLRAVLRGGGGARRAEALNLARGRAEAALVLEPKSPLCIAVLAATQLRTGAAEAALLTLERLEDATQKVDDRAGALRDAFAALAHDALGHADEARAAYEAFAAREQDAGLPPEFGELSAELVTRFQPEVEPPSGAASEAPGAPATDGAGEPGNASIGGSRR